MAARDDALLNVARLLSQSSVDTAEVAGEGLLAPSESELQAGGLRLQGPLAWRVTVRNTGGDDDFITEGEVEGMALMECRRCLTDVATPVHAEFLYPMVYDPAQAEGLALLEALGGEEDRIAFNDPEVDFAPLLTQVFAIDLPLTALCDEACRGLSVDGVNLNEHPEHRPPQADQEETSPFAVLKDLDLDQGSRS